MNHGLSFKTKPYAHQLKEFELSKEAPSRALLWQMRSGKSKVIIDTACHLFLEGEIDAVLILAPNGVHENWLRRELPIHHWDYVARSTLVWDSRTLGKLSSTKKSQATKALQATWWEDAKEMLTDKDQLNWFAFNSESMTRKDTRALIRRLILRQRVLIVFDESHDFGTPGSKRSQMAKAIAKKCKYRRILTGTAVGNSPLAAYSQFELLEPGALGFGTYKAFKAKYALYAKKKTARGHQYDKLVRYTNLEALRASMAPLSSVVLREDCKDLPAIIQKSRSFEMTEEQKRVYRELHKQFVIELNHRDVSIGENSSKLAKLQQVSSGFIIDEFKDLHVIPGENPRLEALSEEVYLAPGKVIIWCEFQQDMDWVVERLMADGHKVCQYHGRVSSKEKAISRALFEPGAENDIKVLVGHNQSGGVGLDLSAASRIINYTHTFNAIHRQQGNERATKVGGSNIPVLDLVAHVTDDYILENTSNKDSISDDLVGRGMREILQRLEI